MATDLTSLTLQLNTSARVTTQKALDLSTPQDTVNIAKNIALAFGTGAAKANQSWDDRRPLAASTGENLDLAGGLTNAFGGTVTFAKIKLVMIINQSDALSPTPTDATIRVTPGASNGWVGPFVAATGGMDITAGGVFIICAKDANGYAVTAGTGDILTVTNQDASDACQYDIIIIGESA